MLYHITEMSFSCLKAVSGTRLWTCRKARRHPENQTAFHQRVSFSLRECPDLCPESRGRFIYRVSRIKIENTRICEAWRMQGWGVCVKCFVRSSAVEVWNAGGGLPESWRAWDLGWEYSVALCFVCLLKLYCRSYWKTCSIAFWLHCVSYICSILKFKVMYLLCEPCVYFC